MYKCTKSPIPFSFKLFSFCFFVKFCLAKKSNCQAHHSVCWLVGFFVFLFLYVFVSFKTSSYSVALVGLEFVVILLPLSPSAQITCVPPCPVLISEL